MTIVYCGVGSIWDTSKEHIVIPVNTVGAMGKGLAKTIRTNYPDVYRAYRNCCLQGRLKIGTFLSFSIGNGQWLLLFPTKESWRMPSKLEWVDSGLSRLSKIYDSRGINSIAFPALGCGEGGLEFDPTVKSLIYKYFDALPIDVEIWLG